ncbi:MAG: amino acid permease [Candidatus Latescibacteria bacterium]|nr:amino acid permease [Candidatus Latescibacterota bacterium]NIM21982.1 amino acid permease [Candidatus Latescibacterota bacterium]NIM66000.1 amino acid permease [Candidatus Latescibacterota bacterium]NIO02408.1 amino acid permease [Candidatus Latescibacterota bacterium]NIO29318.1 amino acid permease [Candidatus Latescibacterota bacterium]
MAEEANNSGQDVKVSFARDLSMFDASMIGIGAMIGAGIFVLTGIAAGEAGPASILAFGLNGLVTLLTALSYAELSSAYPQAGGGYAFIKKAFPGPVGFASGWMLWFSYIVACSLYAMGFGSYFWEFIRSFIPFLSDIAFDSLGPRFPLALMTVVASLTFIAINMRGTALTGKVENVITMGKIAILGIFILFGLRVVFGSPAEAFSSFTPFFPQGFGGVIVAMGLTFIAFEGYDLIATVAEEIKEPTKNIPRATLISLCVAVLIYLLVLFVSIGAIRPETGASWEFLGKYQETAIVRAAENFMPVFGIALIIFGGLLSTTSALNATILASSRVAFSMSRDKMLPTRMSRIHPDRRTPHIAVAATGAIVLVLALIFPIHVIGSSASLMFLLTFALVNLSVIALRRKFPELKGGFRVPLYPVTPIIAISLNLFLAIYQYNFDARSWYITATWIGIGLFLYFVYVEKAAISEIPQVIDVAQPKPTSQHKYRILIPLHNPDHVIPLMQLGAPIARANEAEIIVLGVIEVPQSLPIHEGMRFIHHKAPLLKQAVQYGKKVDVPTRTALRIAHRVSDGILTAAVEHKASLVLMGWKGYTTNRDRIFGEVADRVVRQAPCDLITVKLMGEWPIKKILLPTSGGPHALLATEFVALFQREFDADVACCYVVKKEHTERDAEIGLEWIDKTIHRSGLEGKVDKRIIEANNVAAGLIRAAADYDLLVLGASKEGLFSSVLFGEIPEKVARFSKCPVMIVRRYEGIVKSVVKKVLG